MAIGFIGLGGRGSGGLNTFLGQRDVQVVAVCDVSSDNSFRAYTPGGLEPCRRRANLPPESAYRDFRELLAREDIDALQIATGERWHAQIAGAAARAGKDVYCEKPLALSIEDGKALRAVCQRYGTVFQFGTQQRSFRNFRFACELVRNGRIGRLHTIRVGVYGSASGGATTVRPVPEQLDYEMWLGPVPWRPYMPDCVSGGWNHTSDFALGFLHNWGVHHMDIVQWGHGSESTGPIEIQGRGVFPKKGLRDTATAWDVEMTYADGVRLIYTDNATKVEWQHEQTLDSDWDWQKAGPNPKNKQGVRFEGTEGWVHVSRAGIETGPKSLLTTQIGVGEIQLPRSSLHERNFLDSVRSRTRTLSPIGVAVRADTLCHLAHIAMRTEGRLHWDPKAERFIGNPEANRWMRRGKCGPWQI